MQLQWTSIKMVEAIQETGYLHQQRVVGYPDLVALLGGTVLNQTGQAIETLGLILVFYLALSLSISGLINLWAARQARWAVR